MSKTTNADSFYHSSANVSGKCDPEVEQALRDHDNNFMNLRQSITSLKAQLATATTTTATTSGTSATTGASTSTQTITDITNIASTILGFVNNQTGVTAYATQQSDYGAYIILNDASAVAVSLATSGFTLPWYATFINLGAGTATLTPASGTINYEANLAAASMPLPAGWAAAVAFDGTNFWAELLPMTEGAVGTITGVTAGTGLTGGGTSGNVTLALAATAVTPGSYTNTNLTVNAEGQITAASNGSSSSGYPTVVYSTLSTTTYTGSYTWNSTALVSGAAYRLTVFVTASTSSSGTVVGTFAFTDSIGTFSGLGIIDLSVTTVGIQSNNYTFYSASTTHLTVSFTTTGTISYIPQVIVLERLG